MPANKDYSIDDILNEYADLDKAPPVEYNKEKSAMAQAKAEKELLSLFEELEEEQRLKSYSESTSSSGDISRTPNTAVSSESAAEPRSQGNEEQFGSRFINPDIRGYVPFSGAFEKAGIDVSGRSSVSDQPDIPDDILPNVRILNHEPEKGGIPFDPDGVADDSASSSIRVSSFSHSSSEDDRAIDDLLKELDDKKKRITAPENNTTSISETSSDSIDTSENYVLSDVTENEAQILESISSETEDSVPEQSTEENLTVSADTSAENNTEEDSADSPYTAESYFSETSENKTEESESFFNDSPVISENITEIEDDYEYEDSTVIHSEEEPELTAEESSDEEKSHEDILSEKADALNDALKVSEAPVSDKNASDTSTENDVKRYSRFSFSGNKKASFVSDSSEESEKDVTRRFNVSELDRSENKTQDEEITDQDEDITVQEENENIEPEESFEKPSDKPFKGGLLSRIRKAAENDKTESEDDIQKSSDFSYRSATRIQDKPTKIIKNPENNIRYARSDDDDTLNPKIARKKSNPIKKKLKSEVENLDFEIQKESNPDEAAAVSPLIQKLKEIREGLRADFTGPKTLEQKNQNFNLKSSPEVGFFSIDVPIDFEKDENDVQSEESSAFGKIFTKLGSSFEKSAENKIDDYNSPKDATVILEDLYNLKKGLSVKLTIQIIAAVLSFYLCASSMYKLPIFKSLDLAVSPHRFAFALFIISAVVFFTSFSVISSGVKNIIRKKADCDSLVSVSMIFCTIAAAISAESTIMLQRNSIYIFTPVAITGMLMNTLGKHLIVNRAINNFDAVITTGDKHSLVYIDNEKEAEQLTRGVINDYPILTTTRKTGFSSDFLKYTYSTDIADKLCKKLLPVSLILSLVLSLISALIYSKSIETFSLAFIFSSFTMFLASSSFFGASIVVNLPLADAAAEVEDNESIILGYQSIDDFYDTNAHLVNSKELFPYSSIKLCAMKMFSNTKIDDALVAASSLVINSESIFSGMFDDIIDHDHSLLKKVENFSFEDSMGICGWISNKRVLFGNRQLMLSHNIEGLPPKSKEKDLTGKGKIPVYLSISGNLATMFIIKLDADEKVRESLEILRSNNIALIVKSLDSIITVSRISKLYDFPEEMISIIPGELHKIAEKASVPAEKFSSSVICKGNLSSAAKALSNIRRIHHGAVTALILQSVSVVIAVLVAVLFMCTGMLTAISPIMIILYQVIWLLITLLIIKFRPK